MNGLLEEVEHRADQVVGVIQQIADEYLDDGNAERFLQRVFKSLADVCGMREYTADEACPDWPVASASDESRLTVTDATLPTLRTAMPRLEPRLTFGQHKGERYADVDTGYLRWMTQQIRQQGQRWQDAIRHAAEELRRRGVGNGNGGSKKRRGKHRR